MEVGARGGFRGRQRWRAKPSLFRARGVGGRSAVSRFEREGERGGGGCVATASRGCT